MQINQIKFLFSQINGLKAIEENNSCNKNDIKPKTALEIMELKVWVEGIQRIVCGVTVNTTCQVSTLLLIFIFIKLNQALN